MEKKRSRKQEILQALARELETNPGDRITTAHLAGVVGVSEAALYRHFPSKAKMFESLIEFAEDSVFPVANRIMTDQSDSRARCDQILRVMLTFSERNPGITRVLLGDALVGENERLRERVVQFFDRLETQLRQALRDGQMNNEVAAGVSVQFAANLLLSVIQGRLVQYCRSGFKQLPLHGWDKQWPLLSDSRIWSKVNG